MNEILSNPVEQVHGFISILQIGGGDANKTTLYWRLQYKLVGDPDFHHDLTFVLATRTCPPFNATGCFIIEGKKKMFFSRTVLH